MYYQVRFCHLDSMPKLKRGDTIKRGDLIGKMGSTGASTAPHVHLDIIQEAILPVYRLVDIPMFIKDYHQLMRQYHYLLDSELFDYQIEITSYFSDPQYGYHDENGMFIWEDHMAYDVVPLDRFSTDDHFYLHWPRSQKGRLISLGFDSGYGYYIMIAYDD